MLNGIYDLIYWLFIWGGKVCVLCRFYIGHFSSVYYLYIEIELEINSFLEWIHIRLLYCRLRLTNLCFLID